MNDYFITIVSLSLSASVITLLILLTKPLYKKKASAAWQYYIWLVVIARLLIPYSPEINAVDFIFKPILQYDEQKTVDFSPLSELVINHQEALEIPSSDTQRISAVGIWSIIRSYGWTAWLTIAVVLLIRKIIVYNIYLNRLKKGLATVSQKKINRAYESACMRLKVKRPPLLYTSADISTPMLIGLIKPLLIIPNHICLSVCEMEMVLAHELAHYLRRDIAYKWLLQIALCIHWFNPLLCLVRREISQSCELSCDEAVLTKLNSEEKHAYGDALLAVIKSGLNQGLPVTAITTFMSSDAKQLKKRLEAIMRTNVKTKKSIILVTLLTAALISSSIFLGGYLSAGVNAESNADNTITQNIPPSGALSDANIFNTPSDGQPLTEVLNEESATGEIPALQAELQSPYRIATSLEEIRAIRQEGNIPVTNLEVPEIMNNRQAVGIIITEQDLEEALAGLNEAYWQGSGSVTNAVTTRILRETDISSGYRILSPEESERMLEKARLGLTYGVADFMYDVWKAASIDFGEAGVPVDEYDRVGHEAFRMLDLHGELTNELALETAQRLYGTQ